MRQTPIDPISGSSLGPRTSSRLSAGASESVLPEEPVLHHSCLLHLRGSHSRQHIQLLRVFQVCQGSGQSLQVLPCLPFMEMDPGTLRRQHTTNTHIYTHKHRHTHRQRHTDPYTPQTHTQITHTQRHTETHAYTQQRHIHTTHTET